MWKSLRLESHWWSQESRQFFRTLSVSESYGRGDIFYFPVVMGKKGNFRMNDVINKYLKSSWYLDKYDIWKNIFKVILKRKFLVKNSCEM